METSHPTHDTDATATAVIPIPEDPQAVLEAAPDRATFVLVALERARQWLVSAGSIEEVNELRARAEAVRIYTRQAELGKEAENAAAEIRLRAERRVGELLKEMELTPGRPRKLSSTMTISGLGVDRNQAAAFQRMAAVPDQDFEDRLTVAKQNGRVSRAAVLRDGDAEERRRAREEFAHSSPLSPRPTTTRRSTTRRSRTSATWTAPATTCSSWQPAARPRCSPSATTPAARSPTCYPSSRRQRPT